MEAGPIGQPDAPCIRCGREFLAGARFCFHCGGSRSGLSPDIPMYAPAPMGIGRLLLCLITAAFSAVLLSFGGCAVVVGLSEKGLGGMQVIGVPAFGFGLVTAYGLVRLLRG